jgi:RNA polymerase sigma-70 factor (ECF subfamily)
MSVLFLLFALLSRGPGEPSPEPAPDEARIRGEVEAARRGDRAAIARLYRWHVARVYRALRPSCKSDADAEDLTQDTFVKAFAALDRYEPRPDARFVSWLLAVGANTMKKSARRLRKIDLAEPETLARAADAAGTSDDTSAEAELGELRQLLLAALGELGERERWIVCLRYGGELDVAEVAELTGASEANVRKICERQRRKILDFLSQRGVAPDATHEGANA